MTKKVYLSCALVVSLPWETSGGEDKKEKEGEPTGKRRKRVKRLKSKMYTTEDGAMGNQLLVFGQILRFSAAVTEKVWESESTDEETESSSRGAPAKASSAAVRSSPVKGATKQSLLSNFFLRK